jgi:hypothetical protein
MHDWWANDERRIARFEPWIRMGKNNWKTPENGARQPGRHLPDAAKPSINEISLFQQQVRIHTMLLSPCQPET